MTKRKQPEQQVDTPGTLMDAYGNPGLVSAGELITSAWGNSVAGRVVLRFPTTTALLAATAPAGSLAVSLDNSVYWVIDANGWHTTTLGTRTNFRVTGGGAGQSIPRTVITNCNWAFETDPYNVVSSGVFTVPANWGGRYQFDYSVEFPAQGAATRLAYISVNNDTQRFASQSNQISVAPESQTRMSGSASIVLVPGNTVSIFVYHTDAVANIVNTTANQYFQGFYAGPY